MSDVVVLPIWKNAVNNFIIKGSKPGDLISKSWLMREFGIEEPKTMSELQKAQLKFMGCMNKFQTELLEEHQIALKTVQGVGYEVVAPEDQTRFGLVAGVRAIAKAITATERTVANVKVDSLTDAQRQEHSDGLAKVANMQSMFSRRRLLGRLK